MLPFRATVLLVEDDELVRRAASTILRLNGCEVMEARDGEDALRIFAENSDCIDLVFTDLGMPKCGGAGLVERVRQIRPDVKTLVASGSPQQAPGAFIPKPYCAKELIRKIQDVLLSES